MNDEDQATEAILEAQAARILQITQARAIKYTLSKGLCKKNSLEIYEEQQQERLNCPRTTENH